MTKLVSSAENVSSTKGGLADHTDGSWLPEQSTAAARCGRGTEWESHCGSDEAGGWIKEGRRKGGEFAAADRAPTHVTGDGLLR